MGFQVRELRYFIEQTIRLAEHDGEEYWRQQAATLPPDDVCVTGEEVASALLTWLEQLVNSDDGDDGYDSPGGATLPRSSSRPSAFSGPLSPTTSMEDDIDMEDEDSLDDGACSSSHRGLRRHDVYAPEIFQLGLIELLSRVDNHPGSPTKQGAAEWRDMIAFNVALKRAVAEANGKGETFDLPSFRKIASEHFSTSQRRKHQKNAPSVPPERVYWAKHSVIANLLQDITRRRVAEGLSTWLVASRVSRRKLDGEGVILRELLKSQCETALALENRVKLASRAGGLASCIARLQRSRLRSFCVEWRQKASPPTGGTPPTSLRPSELGR